MMFAILITNYNKLSTIDDAINSSLNQNANIYVVDDCSTDGSYEKLKKNSKLTLLQTETNSGPSIATKLGADIISEPYTILLDGDDALSSNTVEYFTHLLNKYNVDAIYTQPARHRTIDLRNELKPVRVDSPYDLVQDPLSNYLKKQFSTTALCVNTKLLQQALSTDFFIQDTVLAANISRLSNKIIRSTAITHYCSPVSPGNITNDRLQMHKNIISVYLYFKQFPEVRTNINFSKYTRRIYGSLPAIKHRNTWLSPKWQKIALRLSRRYFILNLNHEKVSLDMKYFLDNPDKHFIS